MIKKNKFTKSNFLLPVCFALLLLVVNGTVAWLMSETNSLVSNFTYGDIKISIDEGNDISQSYEIVPGAKLTKDTVVSVDAGSENCWLYVKIEQTENFNDYMEYSVDDGWNLLENYNGVYYRKVDKSNEIQTFNIIKDKVINVHSDLIKKDLDLLNEENYPTLAISAYAFQRNEKMNEIDTAEEAWMLVNGQNN